MSSHILGAHCSQVPPVSSLCILSTVCFGVRTARPLTAGCGLSALSDLRPETGETGLDWGLRQPQTRSDGSRVQTLTLSQHGTIYSLTRRLFCLLLVILSIRARVKVTGIRSQDGVPRYCQESNETHANIDSGPGSGGIYTRCRTGKSV